MPTVELTTQQITKLLTYVNRNMRTLGQWKPNVDNAVLKQMEVNELGALGRVLLAALPSSTSTNGKIELTKEDKREADYQRQKRKFGSKQYPWPDHLAAQYADLIARDKPATRKNKARK